MPESKTREVGIRLSVKDADVAKRALAAFGADGEAALKRLEAASKPASAGLVTLSNAIQRGKEYSRDFALEAARSFLGPVVAIGTAAGAVELLRDALEQVKEVAETGDIAERIGVAVPKLQGLRATFQEMGNDVAGLDAGLQTFAVNLTKASAQGGPLKQIFDLNKVKISGDTLTDLKSVADLVKNARTEQDKIYITQQAFGRGEKELVDLLNGGSAAITRSAGEAERLGTALTSLDVSNARDLTAELARTNIQLDHAKVELGELVTPYELGLMQTFVLSLKDLNYFLAQIKAGNYGEALKTVAGEGFDAGARLRVVERQLKMGTADLTPSMTPDQVSAFYAGFPDIRKPVAITVPGGSTKLPSAPDHAAEQQAKRIQDVTDALNLQIKNLTATNREQEINNALSRAHVTIASEDGKRIAQLAGQYYDQKQAIDAVNQAMTFLGQTGEGVFEDLIDGGKSLSDIFGDVTKSIEKAVLQATLLGSGPLAGIFGTQSQTSGGLGGVFGGLLSGLFNRGATPSTGYVPGLTGPKLFARGGIATQPSIFGDDGAEAAVPLPDGRSIPVTFNGAGDLTMNVSIVHQPGAGKDSVTAARKGNVIDLRATVRDMVGQEIATPGTPADKALRVAFGLTRQTARR